MIRSRKIRSLTIDLPPQIFISANIDHAMWMSVSHFLRIIMTAYHSFSWSSPKLLEARPLWKISNHKPHQCCWLLLAIWILHCLNHEWTPFFSLLSHSWQITTNISHSPLSTWLSTAEKGSAAKLSNLFRCRDSLWLSIEATDYWVTAGKGPGALQIAICQFHNSYIWICFLQSNSTLAVITSQCKTIVPAF